MIGCIDTGKDLEQACINSGGEVSTVNCCNCKDFQALATPNFLCFYGTIEIRTCACPEKTWWNGTTCEDNHYEMNETEKQICINAGGKIGISLGPIGGYPSTGEICDCGGGKIMDWDKNNCVCWSPRCPFPDGLIGNGSYDVFCNDPTYLSDVVIPYDPTV